MGDGIRQREQRDWAGQDESGLAVGTAPPAWPQGLTVLVNAGPWLALPTGSGGLEDVVAMLVTGLRERGVRVVLASVGDTSLPADELIFAFDHGQHARMGQAYVQANSIAAAHMQVVINRIRAGGIELVHDHLEIYGPAMLATMGDDAPPVLHTVHWRLDKHQDYSRFYELLDGRGRVGIVARSAEQLSRFPAPLRRQVVAIVPNGTDVPSLELPPRRDGRLLMLNDIAPLYGTDHIAAACAELGVALTLAGPLAGMTSVAELHRLRQVAAVGTDQLSDRSGYLWFVANVQPHLRGGPTGVQWIGTVTGDRKWRLLRSAAALLTTCTSGQSVIQALTLGVPVITTAEWGDQHLVRDGVNGFIIERGAAALGAALQKLPRISAQDCQESVADYSAQSMIDGYLRAYHQAVHADSWGRV
ncbi:glycosyltransferase involved in cell wall biosynthesis [Catenulispora sp. GAS73]